MGGEVELAAEAVPIAMAAIGAYGSAVLTKTWDEAADATIKAGLQILHRIFGRAKHDTALPAVIAEVAANPGDGDVVAQFRLAVRRAIEADSALAEEVAAIVATAAPSTSVRQHVVAGNDAYVAGRDMTITHRPD